MNAYLRKIAKGTLFINDEPSKTLQNPKWNGLFLESFKGCELSKNKVQWLDLSSWSWSTLKGLSVAKTVYAHVEVIMQFLRSSFSSQCFILGSSNLKEV
jgi:hypothetical protein